MIGHTIPSKGNLSRGGLFRPNPKQVKPDEFYGFGSSESTCNKCCQCPKGDTYRMKDSLNTDPCDIQNCIHGKLVDCPSVETPILSLSDNIHDSIYCSPTYSKIKDGLFINAGRGQSSGGRCMCPDGFIYWAADCSGDLTDLRYSHKETWALPGQWSYKS